MISMIERRKGRIKGTSLRMHIKGEHFKVWEKEYQESNHCVKFLGMTEDLYRRCHFHVEPYRLVEL